MAEFRKCPGCGSVGNWFIGSICVICEKKSMEKKSGIQIGVEFSKKNWVVVKCTKCWGKGYSTQLVALNPGTKLLIRYCDCSYGKRVARKGIEIQLREEYKLKPDDQRLKQIIIHGDNKGKQNSSNVKSKFGKIGKGHRGGRTSRAGKNDKKKGTVS